MKILLIHQYFLEPDEGGGSRFNEMTKIWSQLGHETTVISGMIHANGFKKRPQYKGKFYVHQQIDQLRIWRCHVSEAYNRGFVGRLWGYFSFVFSSCFVGLFKCREKYDVILVTSPPLFVGITAYILSLIKRTPFVFEVRDLWPESAIDTGVLRNNFLIKLALRFEAFMYKKARKVVVLTPAFKDVLVHEKGVNEDKLLFIPNAADFTLSDTLVDSGFDAIDFRKKMDWTSRFVIIYIGAHGVANDLMQVVLAAEKIKNLLPQVLFVLVGDGMEKASLMAEAQKRMCSNIQFLPPVAKGEVFKYVYAAQVGASVLKNVPTFKTIYSNKTFDYMSCKKPILLAIDGVSRDLIEKADCGFFVEPENLDSWVEVITHIVSLPQPQLSVLGENGYAYAKRHFDRHSLAKDYALNLQTI